MMVGGKKPMTREEMRARRMAVKMALETKVCEHIKLNGIQWNEFQRKYGLPDSDKNLFYRCGKPDSSFQSIKKFHQLIFGPMVFDASSIVTNAEAVHIDNTEATESVEISDKTVCYYIRDEYAEYEGDYALIRPSIHEKGVIYGYMSKIYWDMDRKIHCLKIDSPGSVLSTGTIVFIKGFNSVCIHFSDRHQHSMILLKSRTSDWNLYGSMLSLLPTVNEHHYAPASVPVVLVRQEHEIPLGGGYISSKHPLYERCLELIVSVPSKDVVLDGWWSC
jgi:hypothetical protein